jgi:hypothetical protein
MILWRTTSCLQWPTRVQQEAIRAGDMLESTIWFKAAAISDTDICKRHYQVLILLRAAR